MKSPLRLSTFIILALLVRAIVASAADGPLEISGRYPHLAMFDHDGECGTGAVAPWADRLWVITYGPHLPNGSDNKLYEIDGDLNCTIRPESVGGTPADRMIHRESRQLIIGPYFIDEKGAVRTISPKVMPGRLTAAARDLTDPAGKIYIFDMEGMLYEVDVHSLAVTRLFERAAPGAHGKGAYTGQGRLVVANNGALVVNNAKPALDDPGYAKDPEAAGALAQWDGKTWTMIERRQFAEITGPGGIDGAPVADAPVWALGWDKRSVILELLDGGRWTQFRLPISDFTYMPSHGWYTEWPRIREVGGGKMLMNMHGGWFDFPRTFSIANTAGLRPIADYLKITGDFCRWKNRIVFGCDDAALEDTPSAMQSQSNLWFSRRSELGKYGHPSGFGGPWLNDAVKEGEPSMPYLFAGYTHRIAHLANDSDTPVVFKLETDPKGDGNWLPCKTITVAPRTYAFHIFSDDMAAEWIRAKTDRDCAKATLYFGYGLGGGAVTDKAMFKALAGANEKCAANDGTVMPRGHDAGTLQFVESGSGAVFEIGPDMKFHAMAGEPDKEPQPQEPAKSTRVESDAASLIVVQGGMRFRLPKSDPFDPGARTIREVVTERSLLNAGGSFFLLPWPTAGGALKIKPICTHDKRIVDFCSWRGLLVLAGTRANAKPDGHYFGTGDGRAGLWFGDVDDLWKMGKPRGHGGPWLKTAIKANTGSDPYLMTGYDKKSVVLSHDLKEAVRFTIEVDFTGDGSFHDYKAIAVSPGKTVTYEFPTGYSARWVRLKSDKDCTATAQFDYE
jgi:hypothetical protein